MVDYINSLPNLGSLRLAPARPAFLVLWSAVWQPLPLQPRPLITEIREPGWAAGGGAEAELRLGRQDCLPGHRPELCVCSCKTEVKVNIWSYTSLSQEDIRILIIWGPFISQVLKSYPTPQIELLEGDLARR